MAESTSMSRRRTGKLGAVAGANLVVAATAHALVIGRVGANEAGDAYFAGLIVPALITGLLFGTILNATVPYLAVASPDVRRPETWSLLLGILASAALLAVVLAGIAPAVAHVIAPGFGDAGHELTARLLRIGLVGMVAALGSAVLTSWFHARDRFVEPELLGVAGNLVFLLGVVAFVGADDAERAAWLNAVSYVVPFLALLVQLPLGGGRPNPASALRAFGRRARPLVGLGLLQQTEPAVERALVSLGPVGAVALYSLARQFVTASLLVIEKAVAAPVLPALTRAPTEQSFLAQLRQGRRQVTVAAVAVVVAVAALGPMLIPFLVDRLNLSRTDLLTLWHLALLLGPGLAFGAMFSVTAKGRYARGDRWTPTLVAVIFYPVGLALRFGGYAMIGAAGLAIAVSLHQGIQVLSLLRRARASR